MGYSTANPQVSAMRGGRGVSFPLMPFLALCRTAVVSADQGCGRVYGYTF